MNDMTPLASDTTGRRMVEGIARVVAIDGGRVWLEAETTGACASCSAKAGCASGDKSSRRVPRRFAMNNDFDGRIGDRIVVGIPEGALLRASATAYLLPLLAMLAAAVMAEHLGGGDAVAALAAVAGLVGGLVLARARAVRLVAGGRLNPISIRPAPALPRTTGCDLSREQL